MGGILRGDASEGGTRCRWVFRWSWTRSCRMELIIVVVRPCPCGAFTSGTPNPPPKEQAAFFPAS